MKLYVFLHIRILFITLVFLITKKLKPHLCFNALKNFFAEKKNITVIFFFNVKSYVV